jgi:hypothetical protein
VFGSLGAFVPNPPPPVEVALPVITGMVSLVDEAVDEAVDPVFEIVGWAVEVEGEVEGEVEVDVALFALFALLVVGSGVLIALDVVLSSANDGVEKNNTVSVDAMRA